ncbi:MAG: hypothetical protein ACRC0E_08475 [Soonwooa sp.]
MKKTILLTVALLSQLHFGQVTFNNSKFEKNGIKYNISRYDQVFTNQEAKDFVKKGRTNKTVGDILAFTGGFGMGFSLSQILFSQSTKTVQLPFGETSSIKTDNSARWTVFCVSTGIALISIPFYSGANKNFKKAVQIENGETTSSFQPYFKVESAGNALAVSYNF